MPQMPFALHICHHDKVLPTFRSQPVFDAEIGVRSHGMYSYEDPNYSSAFRNSTSAVQVLVTADGHPELDRLIELSSEAPDAWLASAYLLSIGKSPRFDSDALDNVRMLTERLPYWPGTWPDDDWPPKDPTFELPGIPFQFTASIVDRPDRRVGAQRVTVAAATTTTVELASRHWQSDDASFCAEDVNRELGAQYGVIVPRFDVTELAGSERNHYGSRNRLVWLLAELPPERRLALRVHLSDAGMLTPEKLSEADFFEMTAGLRWVIERVGVDGIAQDSDGWLDPSLAFEAESALEWPAGTGAALIAAARGLRLIRRLKGRVVTSAPARKMLARPAVAEGDLIGLITNARSDRDRHALCSVALLSVADGTASSTSGVTDAVREAARVIDDARRYRDYYYDEYLRSQPNAADQDMSEADAVARGLTDAIALMGGVGNYGEFTPAVRLLAQWALL